MSGFSIRLEAGDQALSALSGLVGRLDDATALYDELGRMLAGSTQHRFETETDPAGNPWPDSLRVLTLGGKTLTDSTALRSSITWEAFASGVAVGTNLIYASVHQLGATIEAKASPFLHFAVPGGGYAMVKSVTIPARPFLGISDSDEMAILSLVESWLLDPVAGETVH